METNCLDFEIDKLTNSIENVISGEVFDTAIMRIHLSDRKHIKKRSGFLIGKMNLKMKRNKFIN
jgi:hypothetical protein